MRDKGELIFSLIGGLIVYGIYLIFLYKQFGRLELWSEVVIPMVFAVPLYVFFGNRLSR
jgi:hypothetical protein